MMECIDEIEEYWKSRRRNLRNYTKEENIDNKNKEVSRYWKRHNGELWETNRKKAKERDGYKCVDCGITEKEHRERDDLFGEGLHVHHKKPVRQFDKPKKAHKLDNLITVCSIHHRMRE
jgi:5-methylcytosine-specific restriction endonuclease McrA